MKLGEKNSGDKTLDCQNSSEEIEILILNKVEG